MKCKDCEHEYLLAFSCKRRHFCLSCHQKRGVEFGEWLRDSVLKAVPHRHFTFSMPKILRRYFRHDRELFSELSRCAWKSLKAFLEIAVSKQAATEIAPLENIFQHKVLGMFLGKGKLSEEVGKLIMSWWHSGFNVHCGRGFALATMKRWGTSPDKSSGPPFPRKE